MVPEKLQLGFLKVLKRLFIWKNWILDCDLLYSTAPPYEVLPDKMAFLWGCAGIKGYRRDDRSPLQQPSVYLYFKKNLEKEFNNPYEMFSFNGRLLQQKINLFGISHSHIKPDMRYSGRWYSTKLEKWKYETQGKLENGAVSEISWKLKIPWPANDRSVSSWKCKEPPDLCKRSKWFQGLCPWIFPERRENSPVSVRYEGYDSRQ